MGKPGLKGSTKRGGGGGGHKYRQEEVPFENFDPVDDDLEYIPYDAEHPNGMDPYLHGAKFHSQFSEE